MQDRDELERLLNSKLGTLDDLQKEPMPAKAVKRTISLLPNQGDVIKLRGLDFSVRFVNKSTGVLHLSLTRVAEQRDAPVHAGQPCPSCNGYGTLLDTEANADALCPECEGTGWANRPAGG